MKIAMLAPISWRVPPRHYGPWELCVSLLTEGLVRRGLDVTLFATADSVTSAKLESICPRPLSEDGTLDGKVWECLHIAHLMERAKEFDLIHNHFDFLPLSYSGLVSTPLLTTIHGFSSERILPVYKRYNRTAHYVAISEADRSPELDYAAVIHHGIDLESFPFQKNAGEYLLFFGRIHPDKGPAEAIAVAKATGLPLKIAGIIHDEDYHHREVEPHLDGKQIVYLGPVSRAEGAKLLGSARALLHLINFAEPFGLSVVESFACGTPVIARPLGSMRELVRPGVNGFFADNVAAAVHAVEKCAELPRQPIRDDAMARFGVERMVSDYVRVYEKITRASCPCSE